MSRGSSSCFGGNSPPGRFLALGLPGGPLLLHGRPLLASLCSPGFRLPRFAWKAGGHRPEPEAGRGESKQKMIDQMSQGSGGGSGRVESPGFPAQPKSSFPRAQGRGAGREGPGELRERRCPGPDARRRSWASSPSSARARASAAARSWGVRGLRGRGPRLAHQGRARARVGQQQQRSRSAAAQQQRSSSALGHGRALRLGKVQPGLAQRGIGCR